MGAEIGFRHQSTQQIVLDKMPSFNDSITVQELIDLVTYLRFPKPVTGGDGGHQGH
ncbi:MAG: hypothetical protein ACREK6_14180 [Candidatus Rokuibacteriota bacterium]